MEPLCLFKIQRRKKGLSLHWKTQGLPLFKSITEWNGPVSQDSCAEFFFQAPAKEGYFNLEINAFGTPHLAFGPDRRTRTFCPIKLLKKCDIQSLEQENKWELKVLIPYEIFHLWQNFSLETDSLIGNVYVCIGCQKHYQSLFPIKTKTPDFHRPEFFQKISLKS